jgi:hypothetical protein
MTGLECGVVWCGVCGVVLQKSQKSKVGILYIYISYIYIA